MDKTAGQEDLPARDTKKKILRVLRIKRIYFDRILSGEKKSEFRDAKPYYTSLLEPKPDFILFHYQNPRDKIIARVLSVEKIPTPERLKVSAIPFGPEVYEIKLGKVKKIIPRQ